MAAIFKGILHGKHIELEETPNLPDGQLVTVIVQAEQLAERLPPAEGLRRAFGGWAADAGELDEFLDQVRVDRRDSRPEPRT